MVDIWRIAVARSQTTPGFCTFTWVAQPLNSPPPLDTHVLVTVQWSTIPFRRTSFVIGFQPYTSPLGCQEPYEVVRPSSVSTPTCP
jgi:hypothetical protein